jgi:hypothetical protein
MRVRDVVRAARSDGDRSTSTAAQGIDHIAVDDGTR